MAALSWHESGSLYHYLLRCTQHVLCVGMLFVAGCQRASAPKPGTPPPTTSSASSATDRFAGTREMAALLQSIAANIDPNDTTILINRERAQMLKRMMDAAPDAESKNAGRLHYAIELLRAGDNREALKQFNILETDLKHTSPDLWKANRHTILGWQAIGYLRIGEQENCCSANTPDSCLVPIVGQGVHTKQEGSKRAMELFEQVLRDYPEDKDALWLLNIAAMTLGAYPSSVPAQWRIPPKVFASDYDIKKFPNIASRIGLDLLGRSGGCIIDDFDGDGLLDIVVSGIGFQDQLRFFHNNGDGTFSDRTQEAGLTGETGGLNLIQGDYNNDGHPDILVLRGGWMDNAGNFPLSLLRNNGDGTFSDVTKEAGLLKYAATQTAVWLDYNNDGKLDLFVGYESGKAGSHPCSLYRNNGDGTFTDVAEQAGVDFVGFVKGVVSADYDNDGWPDLYLSVFGGKNLLFHNNGNGTFTEVGAKAGVTEPKYSFGTFFFDYDNDGWPDLFVCGYRVTGMDDVVNDYLGKPNQGVKPRLYHNNHDGTFTDVTKEVHLDRVITGMALNFGDLDNDGYLDFFIGTGSPNFQALVPKRMFRNADGRYFQDVTTSGDFGHLQKGHGIAFADLTNTGNQDVFEELGGAYYGDIAYSALFANPGHGNHWITLKLEGVQTNRSAIGARIHVTVDTPAGRRNIYRTVGSGGSFGANPLRQEIGLGQATNIVSVEIYWPVSKKTQTLTGLNLDSIYQVWEDRDQPVLLHLKQFQWPSMKP